jgi:outer membrane protein
MPRRLRAIPAAALAGLAVLLCVPGAAGAQAGATQTAPTTQPGSTPAPKRLTLQDAVATALQNSKALRISAEAVTRARGRVNESRAGYLPTVGSQATFTRLDQGSSIQLAVNPGSPPVTIPIVIQNQRAVAVTAALPLDIAGMTRAAVQASEFQEIAARLDFNRARNQLVSDVRNAYLNVLRGRAFVTVAGQALQNARDRQATAEAYLRAGTGTRFDVLRAQTDVANAQQNLISAQNRVNLANASLNNALGLDQNTPLETVEPAEVPEAPEARDFNKAVSSAYATRPEILQAEAQVRAAEKGVVLAERSVLPSLGLAWNFQYSPDAGGFVPKETSWAAVATVSLPLFDAGLSRARRQQAKADVSSARTGKLQVMDNIALDVRQNYLSLTEAQDRLSVTSAGLAQAEEQYRLAQVRFKAGVTLAPGASPLLEISDAQTALTQAQSNQINAQYDLQAARAGMDRAIGRYAYNGAPGMAQPSLGGPK